jgi:phosphate transport system ATP-binding protein
MISQPHIQFSNVSVRYEDHVALQNISLSIARNEIFGIIGPANAGKTTFLKCINRMLEFIPTASVQGTVSVAGENVRSLRNVYRLRRRIGMVFPLPVGLPMSVYENVAYAPRQSGIHERAQLDEIVERCLRQSMLWDEVKDRLNLLGTHLSGGQQQRLTIARALSHDPEILCLDEFSIAIDPVTTMKIEDMLAELKKDITIVLVTNLVQQARRLADHTAFFNDSELVEVGTTEKIFSEPENPLTYEYVTGGFG